MKEKFSISTTIIVTLFLTLTLWVFGPAKIFLSNSLEFNLSFWAVAPYLLAIAALAFVIIYGIVYMLRNKYFPECISLVFTFGLLLWIQGNLLVWQYGPLDGREIHWNKMVRNGLIDSGVWILLIVLVLVKSKAIFKIAQTASIGFILIQLISATMLYMKAPELPSFKRYYIDDANRFSFSSKKNVIVILLDTYQSDLFQEIINEDERYKEIYRGFTYFRNNLSVFPKTYLSAPSILTGCVYDNTVPVQEFLKSAYHSNTSLPKILKQNGYRVELYPYPHTENTIYFDETIASNIKKREPGMFSTGDFALLLDISLFRHAPHFVKRLIYRDQEWLIKKILTSDVPKKKGEVKSGEKNELNLSKEALKMYDVRFIAQMVDESIATGETPVFKYYHLNGLHRPLVLNEKLESHDMPYSQRSSFKSQGKACLEITRLLFEKLKRLGQYENSTIIVLGDHGCADYPYGVKIEEAGLTADEPQGVKIPSHIKAAGLSLVLIKPGGASDEDLKITDAPVSLKDIPPTVFTILGIKPGAGTSMYNVTEGEKRERHFYYYNWNGWGNDYLYSMRDYAINGHAWLDSSWRENGVVRPASAKTPYEYGKELDFGRGGNSVRYMGIGWHGAGKDGFTWTREKKAELYFYLNPSGKDLVLKMNFKPFIVPGKLDKQELHVKVNGQEIRGLRLTDSSARDYEFIIPKEMIKGKELSVVFEIPTALSPAEMNLGKDVRNLGIAVKTAVLEEKK